MGGKVSQRRYARNGQDLSWAPDATSSAEAGVVVSRVALAFAVLAAALSLRKRSTKSANIRLTRCQTPMCAVTGTIGAVSFEGFGARDYRFGTRWPRETGGMMSGGSFDRERVTLVYAFGQRAHVLELTAGACAHEIVDHHKPPQTMLCETVRPSRFASLLNRAGDR